MPPDQNEQTASLKERRNKHIQMRNKFIYKALKKGLDPGSNIPWKRFQKMIVKLCKVTLKTNGFMSEENFRELVRKARAGKL